MSRTTKHTKTLHRHMHPIHWHGSMFVAIAAIVLTSLKSSGEMLKALEAVPVHANVMVSSLHMREAETGHAPILVGAVRHATLSGR